MDSVNVEESKRKPGWLEPTSAEIERSDKLFLWYGEWLHRHTEPGKILTKSRAIYGAVMDARKSLGFGSHQTIRGYLKSYTDPTSGDYRETSDPGTGMKWVERRPKKEDLDEKVQLALLKLDRDRFVKTLEQH